MNTDINPIEALLQSLDVRLPVEFLSRIDAEEYLDELDKVVVLMTGERQRLAGLLHAAGHITLRQFADALEAQQHDNIELGDVLTRNGALTRHDSEFVLEFQRRRADVETMSKHFALGNILVANRQITREQLEHALHQQIDSGRKLGDELIHTGHASKIQIDRGLSLQRRLVAIALAVATALAPVAGIVPAAQAGQASTNMAVSIRVVADAKMHTDYHAALLTVTAADIARGFLEIQSASRFSISADRGSGYSVEFRPVGNLFDSAQVVGLGRTVQLSADGGTVFLRDTLSPKVPHELSYRFNLSPGTLPGTYPWPLQLSVSALPAPH